MKIAYFDCFAGAAGDMIVGAMLDAGLDAQFLKDQLAALGINDLTIEIAETTRGGLRAKRFIPKVPDQHEHRNISQITELISKSKISDKAKETAIAAFDKLARAEAAIHNMNIENVHFHEVGQYRSELFFRMAKFQRDAGGEQFHPLAKFALWQQFL